MRSLWPGQRRRLALSAVGSVVAFVVAGAAPAAAQEAPPVVALAPSRCAPAVVDAAALAEDVRGELAEALGRTPTIADSDAADYRVALDCSTRGIVIVSLTRTRPPALVAGRVAVAALAPAERPRAIAHEVGQLLRRSMQPPTAPTMAGPLPPEVAIAGNSPSALFDDAAHQRRLRLTRDLAIAGAAVTVAGVVIGAPLLANGDPGGLNRHNVYIGFGGALLAVAGVSLVATVVSFTLWLHERHRRPTL